MKYVATIGMFDGVHKGHQFVLRQVVACAGERGLQSMAITFDQSPRQEQLLTPLDEKLRLITEAGIDHVEVLSFTPSLKTMTARQFMEQMLKEQLDVQVLLIGYDNRFGHLREEGFEDYVRYGRELGIEVIGLPAEGDVSSSRIRQLLVEGRIDEATKCLGHPYTMTGRVTHGEHVGTELGFPTANLLPNDSRQLIPANGVYAVRVSPLTSQTSPLYKGMMNIGTRPTFNGDHQTLEVHLFNFDQDLYDQQLAVSFVSRLREERRFDSREALRTQLQKDALLAEKVLKQS